MLKERLSVFFLRSPACPRWLRLLLSGCAGILTYLLGTTDYHFTKYYQLGASPAFQRQFLCFLFALAAFGGTLLLLRCCRCSAVSALALTALCLLAMAARIYYLERTTQDYNYFLSSWVQMYRDGGGYAAFGQTIGDYNAPYLYFLAGFSYLPLSDFYLIKLLSILFDFVLAFAVVRIVDHFALTAPARVAAAGLTLLFPTVVFNSGWWAQCDSIYVSFLLLSFSALLKGRGKLGLALAAISFSFKLQAVFFFPMLVVFWLAGRLRLRDLWAFPAAYAGIILPALLLGKPLREILLVYIHQTGTYASRLTLNAPSIFQFAPSDAPVTPLFWGGIFAAALFVCMILLNCWERREGLDDRTMLILLLLFSAGIPLLLPSMHERYYYLAELSVILIAVVMPRRSYLLPLQLVASLSGYLAYLLLRYAISMRLGCVCLMTVVVLSYLLFKLELWKPLEEEKTAVPAAAETAEE